MLQPKFELQPGFRDLNEKWVRPINYIGDFAYKDKADNTIVEDTKGFKTKEFLLKAKMFQYWYRDIKLVIL